MARAPLQQGSASSSDGPWLASNFRTVVCSSYRSGFCAFGDSCTFAHPGSFNVTPRARTPQRQTKRVAKANRRDRERSREDAERSKEQHQQALLQKFERELQQDLEQEQLGGPRQPPPLPPPLAPPQVPQLPPEPPQGARPAAAAEQATEQAGTDAGGRSLRFVEPTGANAEAAGNDIGTGDGEKVDERRQLMLGLFESEPWDVLLSDNAFEHLQQSPKNQQKHVLQTLKGLASGHWTEAQRKEAGSHGPMKLRRAPAGDLGVLWGIDVEFSRDRDAFVEVLQVWDIVGDGAFEETKDAILQEWQRSRRSFQGLQKALQQQKLSKADADKARLPRVVARSDLQDPDVFSVRKFFGLDRRMLESILFESAGDQGAVSASERFPLRISKQEAAIVEKPGPMIVIGRSGSGKTLCCVYRMYFEHQRYWEKSREAGGAPLLPGSGKEQGLVHLNQVFVTHSASLANKVLEYFSNLQGPSQQSPAPVGAASSALAGASAGRQGGQPVEQSRLPDSLKGVRHFPLFVTFRKLLVMIDGCTDQPFFPRRPGGTVHDRRVDLAEPLDALDPLSALREQRRAAQRAQALGATGAQAHGRDAVLTEVDYELFRRRFWPKLRQQCPNGCDPSLVWREIQSYIKGSYRVLDSSSGALALADYQDVARKCSPGFDECRGQIYDAFKTYEELRRQWNCFDRMDAVLHVIRQLQRSPYTGPLLHTIAVDEVQDLAQLELALFFLVSKRPYDGLFITGDTSQTVSRAIDFRFCDLRSIFHHFKVSPPEIDQLIINYRSHERILALSHRGVVRPLELAFPHAVDTLQADTGHRDGPQPIVVTDVRLEDLATHLFNLDGSAGGIAFGASQCILVRSEAAKAALPEELRRALVLTVEQSKGLEFDDVILVNFFGDSAYSEWQVMKNFREELLEESLPEEAREAHKRTSDEPRKRPHFERYRHTLLCSELKHLYTAMTRTKHVLLLIEQDVKQAQSVFDLWQAMELVSFGLLADENKEALEHLISRAGESKGEESWRAVGRNLLQKQLFEQARSCFIRARDDHMAQVCEAYLLARRAAEALVDSQAEGIALYLEAAELFHKAGGAERERAVCLLQGDKPLEAAKIFDGLGPELRSEAARAYDRAGHHKRAGQIYEEVGSYREALDSLAQVDATVDLKRVVLRAHEEKEMKADECFRYLQDMESHDVAAELYLREEDFAQAASCFESAGLPEREAECYMRLGERKRAADVLSTSADTQLLRRAADIYINLGLRPEAAQCYKSLLQTEDVEDREQLLELSARILEDLEQWSSAAELWEQLQRPEFLDRAIDGFEKSGKMGDAGRACEKRAARATAFYSMDGMSYEKRRFLERAARHYNEAKQFGDALRVYEELGEWSLCGRIARQQGDLPRAADFHRKAGERSECGDCLMEARDFEAALEVLRSLGTPDFGREAKCLEGLGRFNEAAKMQMKALPEASDEESRRDRGKLALQAFDTAKRDQATWKDFLVEFEHEMPDSDAAIAYFAEMSAVDEVVTHLQKQQKPLVAAGAASLMGNTPLALELLMSFMESRPEAGAAEGNEGPDFGVPEGFDAEAALLEVMENALECGEEQLEEKLADALGQACDWLRNRPGVAEPRLELVEATLMRRRKQPTTSSGKTKGKGKDWAFEAASVKKALEASAGRSGKKECFKVRASEEVALAPGATLADVEDALDKIQQLHRRAAGARGQHIVESIARDFYCACPALHGLFMDYLRKLGSTRTKDEALVVPCSHALAKVGLFDKIPAVPAAVEVNDQRAAVLEDFECRAESLLGKLASLPENAANTQAALAAPRLWHRALEECKQKDRKARLQKGLTTAVQRACRMASAAAKSEDQKKRVREDLARFVPDCAKDLWTSAREKARAGLRDPTGKNFKQVASELQEAIHEAANMFKVEQPDCNDVILVERLMDLVLAGLRGLEVICPNVVETRRCNWVKTWGKCPCDHNVHFRKTTDPWFLLNFANKKSKWPELDGIGLQGWLDVNNICFKFINGECQDAACRFKHLPEDKRKAAKKELGESAALSLESAEVLVKVLSDKGKDKNAPPRTMPQGFGLTFFHDEDKAEEVRLTAILATELTRGKTRCPTKACQDLLVRMCRAAFRYPDVSAVELVRAVLKGLNDTPFQAVSKDITWEVFGGVESEHNVLESFAAKGPQRAAPKAIMQKPTQPSVSTMRASAPVFQPRGQQPPPQQPDRWVDGNAAEQIKLSLYKMLQATVASNTPAASSPPQWQPSLRPSTAPVRVWREAAPSQRPAPIGAQPQR